MKYTCLTVMILLCMASLSHSQVRIAVLGGPHSASVLEENNIPGWDVNVKPRYSSRPGFHIGILTEIPLSSSSEHWFIQPGVLYQAKGRKFLLSNDSATAALTDTIFSSQNFSVNYIEFPLNLAYKINLSGKVRFLLSAGPYVGFFYNGKQKEETRIYSSNTYTNNEFNLESGKEAGKIKTFDFGLNARAGFEIGTVLLTGFISRGLTDFYTASYDESSKHQVIGASIGFWLNKVKPELSKPKDSDNDGIADDIDDCPTLPGIAATNGCPDKDGDGIADNKDKCPDIAGAAKYNGCPIPDSDKDGINDELDKCPDEAGVEQYHGCPVPDSDGDGITDIADSCPDKAGTVEFNGCPIPDSDGDGLNDQDDKCPAEAGSVDNKGCPEIKTEVVERINYVAKNILFNVNSDSLTSGSFASLDELATLLSVHPSIRLIIEGHTDATGPSEYNKQLSQKRAEAALQYIVKKGIDPSRLTAVGYGSDKPITENKTKKGQAINRRVELKLVQY